VASSDVAKKRNISENTIQPDTSNNVEKRNSIGNTSSLPHPVHDINMASNKETGISVLKRICSRVTNLAVNRYSLDSFLLKLNSNCSNSVSSSSDNSNDDKKANESQDNVKTSSKNDEDQSSSSSKQTDINDRSGSTSSSSDYSNIDEEASVS